MAAYNFQEIQNRQRIREEIEAILQGLLAIERTYGAGQSERERSLERLERSMAGERLRLVFLGEFSRGKSFLINALLDIDLLPTAQEQTTAINTFLRSGEGGEDHIEIHFQDGHRETIPFSDEALRLWGTELDRSHRDTRREVDRIHVHKEHHLLALGLEIIDTPGFAGLLEHHETIAHRAIDEAHVAIWVLSANQLGGNREEWRFMNETLSRNFSKFITVVNWWDLVLDPQDAHERLKPPEAREREKLAKVAHHFQQEARHLSPEKVQALTAPQNLMGVSALWAKDPDPERQRRSHIRDLARRIEEICTQGEGQLELLRKPLHRAAHLCQEMTTEMQRRLQDLQDPPNLAQIREDKERLHDEIGRLRTNTEDASHEAEIEHQHHLRHIQGLVTDEIIEPLHLLKEKFITVINRAEMERQIQRGKKRVTLPENLQSHLQGDLDRISERWNALRKEIKGTLEALRQTFQRTMEPTRARINQSLESLGFAVPPMDLSFNMSFAEMERYEAEHGRLEAERESLEKQIIGYAEELDKGRLLEEEMASLKNNLASVRRALENLGPCPAPRTYTGYTKETRGWINKRTISLPETRLDTSARDHHLQEQNQLHQMEQSREQRVEELMEKLKGRVTLDHARRMAEREIEQIKNKLARMEREAEIAVQEELQRALSELQRRSLAPVEAMIKAAQRASREVLPRIFDENRKELLRLAQEQMDDKLQSRQKDLQRLEDAIQAGEAQVQAERQRVGEAHSALEDLNHRIIEIRLQTE